MKIVGKKNIVDNLEYIVFGVVPEEDSRTIFDDDEE